MSQPTFEISPENVALLTTIESGENEEKRRRAADKIAQSADVAAGRVMLEIFERCMWRSTKISIVRALGPMNFQRGNEFLVRLAGQRIDLSLAGEALLALGNSGSPFAGEYLLSVIRDREHPLCREAVIALTRLTQFPSEEELCAVLDRPAEELPASLLQYLIIALGRRGYRGVWGRLKEYLKDDVYSSLVVNAGFITAGYLGDSSTLQDLARIDTRYRFFADQLKTAAMERITFRNARSEEDAVSALLASEDSQSLNMAIQFLREFPTESAWEAFALLGQEAPISIQAQVRAALFLPNRIEEDMAFLSKHRAEIAISVAVSILKQCQASAGEDIIKDYFDQVGQKESMHLLTQLRYAGATTYLANVIRSSESSDEFCSLAVNGLVAQALMHQKSDKASIEIGALLLELLNQTTSPPVRHRIIRALGQIEYSTEAFLIALGSMLKEKDVNFESIYAALGNLPGEEPVRIVLRRIKKLATGKDSVGELAHALSSLASSGEIDQMDLEQLASIDKSLWGELELPLLKIMSRTHIPGAEELVLQGLVGTNFQSQMLAVAAAKFHRNPEISQELFKCLNGPNVYLAGRSLDSLCHGGSFEDHLKLMDWLGEEYRSHGEALKAMRSLQPEPGKSYRRVVDAIDQLLGGNLELFKDAELREASTNLRDNLSIATDSANPSRSRLGKQPDGERHKLDHELSQRIVGFENYSEVVKTVLRNAELTFMHSDLFDDRVDKSTIVVEFVKSIDLLLQEKIGSMIFLSINDMGSRMHSRILQLGLEQDVAKPAQLIKDLQCTHHFTAETFPAHKLWLLSQAIVSGKIMHEQYHCIDGLRAWALILLLYARKFKYRQTQLEPILAVSNSSNPLVCDLAAKMMALQEMRNLAAHRGTVVNLSRLEDMRQYSFDVLNHLQEMLFSKK